MPASAMTTGATFDGDDHPAIVAMVVVSPEHDVATMYCSGTVVKPTVVVTASHCNVISDEPWFIAGGYTLGVTNSPELGVPDGEFWFPWTGAGSQADVTEVRTNPLYRGGYRDDVSVQLISHPLDDVDADDMPALPAVGLLDDLQKAKTLRSTVSLVLGYGSEQQVIPAVGGKAFPDSNERRWAELGTTALDKQSIHQSMRVTQGAGGACYGDSGGPTLMTVSGRTYLVGVTSTGDMPCFATNVAGRVDTQAARDWIEQSIAAAASQ